MNKKKKIIICIAAIIVLLAAAIVVYLYLNRDSNTEKNTITNTVDNSKNVNAPDNVEYTYTEYGPGFFCSNEPLGSNPMSYMIGEYVYCAISFEIYAGDPGIHEIWAEYSLDEDVEYIETLDTGHSEWTLEEDGNKFHLITNRPTAYAEYFYQVQFRIKPTTKKEKVTIEFKNIKYKDAENNYYKTDSSVRELNISETTNYSYKEDEDYKGFTFYKLTTNEGYKQINQYSCNNASCNVYATECTWYMDLEKGKMLLNDGGTSVLYDFEKGVLGTYDTDIEYIGDYFIVRDTNSKKYGIVDMDGKITKEFNSDGYGKKLAKCLNRNTHSTEHDLIIEKKNDKYGVVKISKDEVVIDYKFDDIRVFNDKYFKAKTGDDWHLYNISTKEKEIENGYKELFIVNDEIIIAQIDNYLYIKDYKGNNIIEDKIEVFMDYKENACCGMVSGIGIREENGIVYIHVNKETENEIYMYDTDQYEYNIKDKKLTKKDSTN